MSSRTAARHKKDQNHLNKRINDTLDLQLIDAYATSHPTYEKKKSASLFNRLQTQINSIKSENSRKVS